MQPESVSISLADDAVHRNDDAGELAVLRQVHKGKGRLKCTRAALLRDM